MKSFLNLVALCAVVALAGCSSNKTESVSPGAVGEKSSGCCSGKTTCTDKANTSMGAVGEKTECTKTCPMTGKTETVSPGAVGEKKSGCCSSKAATVSPGAVSDAPAKKSGCCSGKTSCGSAKSGG